MRKYIIGRLALSIPTLFGITVLIFLAMRVLPGDPVAMIATEGQGTYMLTEAELAKARASLGLDKPLHIQYLSWMGDIARGDLGKSFWRGEPIRDLIARRGPITAQIALTTVLISWLIGIPVGMFSAMWRRTLPDYVTRVIVTVFMAVPSFWVGLMMVLFSVLVLNWRPSISIIYPWDDFVGNAQMILGPSIAMGLGLGAVTARDRKSVV
jgi:peptide/nickel transport system permease protein